MSNDEIAMPAKDVKALVRQASDRFKDEIKTLLERKHAMSDDLLQWKYDVGIVAGQIMSDKSKALHERSYGEHIVADVAMELDMSDPNSVYTCVKFSAVFSKRELKRLLDKRWPWRGIVSLLGVENKEDREKFMLAYEGGEYKNTDALKKAITTYNEKALATGVKTEKRGSKSTYVTPIKSADTIITKVTSDTLPSLLEALNEVRTNGVDDDKRDTMKEKLDHIIELIPAMTQMLEDTQVAIDRVEI